MSFPIAYTDLHSAVAPSTPEVLVEVAEALFAANGYNGTSVREITAQAQVNIGAVSYHFGTKANLLKAILRRGAAKLIEERMRRLAALNIPGNAIRVDQVIRAFIEPVFDLMGTDHGVRFLRIQNDISAQRTDVAREVVFEHYDPCVREYLLLLAQAAPHAPHETLLWSFQFLLGALLHSTTHAQRFPELRGQDIRAREVEALVRFAADGLTAGECRDTSDTAAVGRPKGCSAQVGRILAHQGFVPY